MVGIGKIHNMQLVQLIHKFGWITMFEMLRNVLWVANFAWCVKLYRKSIVKEVHNSPNQTLINIYVAYIASQ